jgi:hypothetical protein
MKLFIAFFALMVVLIIENSLSQVADIARDQIASFWGIVLFVTIFSVYAFGQFVILGTIKACLIQHPPYPSYPPPSIPFLKRNINKYTILPFRSYMYEQWRVPDSNRYLLMKKTRFKIIRCDTRFQKDWVFLWWYGFGFEYFYKGIHRYRTNQSH